MIYSVQNVIEVIYLKWGTGPLDLCPKVLYWWHHSLETAVQNGINVEALPFEDILHLNLH